MPDTPTVKRRLYIGAVTLGLALGAAGVAGAQTGGAPAPTADPAVEVAEPSYVGSIAASEVDGQSEADEAAALAASATLLADDAAAKAAELGSVGTVELDNENGSVVYSVAVTTADGAVLDVKVDAGDGTILDQQADDGEEDEAAEAAESDEDDDGVQHENEHEGENDPDENHED